MLSTFCTPRRSVFSPLGRSMNELFEQFFSDGGNNISTYQTGAWQARLAIWEKDDKLHLELEVPGVSKDDIELTVDEGKLRISGERKAPEEERADYYSERRYGPFERVVRLPKQFDPESVEAAMSDGVLHVTLAKRPEAQPKKITVK